VTDADIAHAAYEDSLLRARELQGARRGRDRRAFERFVAALGLQPIDLFGSDSLDNPEAVFQ